MTRSCPSCGATLTQAAVRFCVSCGSRLSPGQAATQPAAPAPPEPQQPPHPPHEHGPPWYPGDGMPEGGQEGTGRRRRGGLIALVIIVILAGGGAGAYALIRQQHDRGSAAAGGTGQAAANSTTAAPASSSPASSASEQQQLSRFLAVVQGSASARNLVKTAVPQVGTCAMSPADGAAQLQQAISDRQGLLTTIAALQVSAIPSGETMRADLAGVLNLSIAADSDFTQWMQDPQSTQGCPSSTSADAAYTAGYQASRQAQQAKAAFLALWNPLARQFGQPTFTTADI